MSGKIACIVTSGLIGLAIWYYVAAFVLREDSSRIPTLNLVVFASAVVTYLLIRKWGAGWSLVFPVTTISAAMYFGSVDSTWIHEYVVPDGGDEPVLKIRKR